MLSKSENAIIKSTGIEDGCIIYSQYKSLPDKKVLFLTKDKDKQCTTLKIFSIDDLNTCLVKTILENDWRLLNICPNGSILLQKFNSPRNYTLVKLCSETLNILSSFTWQGTHSLGVIDNDSFFVIKKADDSWKTGQQEQFLHRYKWNENSCMESQKIQLNAHPGTGGDIVDINSLGNNRFCCHLRGHNTAEFKVLIFDIDPDTNAVEEIGLIEPKAQHEGSGSAASGTVMVLPNGNLLTYHDCHDNVQIWDSKTLKCILEWNWLDNLIPGHFSIWCVEIKPFPDSVHLMVIQGENIYLFNMKKLEFSLVKFDTQVELELLSPPHILHDGQVIAFFRRGAFSQNTLNIMHFDLPKIANCRKIMTESKPPVRPFFDQSQSSGEITNNFTPEATLVLSSP